MTTKAVLQTKSKQLFPVNLTDAELEALGSRVAIADFKIKFTNLDGSIGITDWFSVDAFHSNFAFQFEPLQNQGIELEIYEVRSNSPIEDPIDTLPDDEFIINDNMISLSIYI